MKKFAFASFVVGVATLLAACSSDGDEPTAMGLQGGEGDALASCLAFDPARLAEMPVAFEGTVTDVEGERVTLDVDEWFKGGDADEVQIVAPQGLEALIGGINFESGETYLVSATDGNVNYCGFSGEATPELRAGFDEAFGG